ncbi:MAG: type 4a pilus biogenesis protein PilO [Candidatus Omnitrophica bacterium]|jgi:Tfp pilus assembly protein PilO|nr:type 4a pilus biogenesis protein PilO [Candidatus Omnitrophota bacterium]
MLKKLSSREKYILAAVIFVILLSLLYTVLIEPMMARRRDMNNRIGIVKAKLRKSLALMKDKSGIEQEYDHFTSRLKQAVNDEQVVTVVLDELEKAAQRTGVSITSMRPKPAKQKQYFRQFEVEVETESDMAGLMKFIFEIKNSPQLIKIDKLNLNTKGGQQAVLIRAFMLVSKISIG